LIPSERPDTVQPQEQPFDGFDDVAENVHESHHHPKVATTYKSGTGRRLAITGILLVIALVGGFTFVSAIKARDQAKLASVTEERSAQPPTVEVVTVTRAPATQSLQLPGEARGWYTSIIFARVSGYVSNWLVDIGDSVKKNQVLAIIDTPELDAQLQAAKAQLSASEAEVKVKEADAQFAKTTYERWEGSAKGVVSEQEREDKRAGYASAAAKLAAQQARVNLDKSNVDKLTYLTQFKKVVAPYDGVITDRRIDIGDLVTAGSTTNTSSLFGIAQYDKVRVFSNVPQSASGDIEIGKVAKAFTMEHQNRVYEGKISRTSQSIDVKARTLRVEVDIDNPGLTLLPGTYLQVMFQLKSATFLQIPASALIFTPSGPQVALIQPDSTVKFQNIVIGRDDGNVIEVASGLSEGDRVALNISNQISDGMKVGVRQNEKIAAR
jgi:RND family efflux transporter MFP subunit